MTLGFRHDILFVTDHGERRLRISALEDWWKNNPEAVQEMMSEYTRKKKIRDHAKKWRAGNKDLIRNWNLLRKYRITYEDLKSMLERQDFKCPICKSELRDIKSTHVDHDHKTGKVRSALCMHCNCGLGNAKESIEILESMIEYLRKYTRELTLET